MLLGQLSSVNVALRIQGFRTPAWDLLQYLQDFSLDPVPSFSGSERNVPNLDTDIYFWWHGEGLELLPGFHCNIRQMIP